METKKININNLIVEVTEILPRFVDYEEIIDLCLKWKDVEECYYWDAVEDITETLWPEEEEFKKHGFTNDEDDDHETR